MGCLTVTVGPWQHSAACEPGLGLHCPVGRAVPPPLQKSRFVVKPCKLIEETAYLLRSFAEEIRMPSPHSRTLIRPLYIYVLPLSLIARG
jgi:hypothetical protein